MSGQEIDRFLFRLDIVSGGTGITNRSDFQRTIIGFGKNTFAGAKIQDRGGIVDLTVEIGADIFGQRSFGVISLNHICSRVGKTPCF